MSHLTPLTSEPQVGDPTYAGFQYREGRLVQSGTLVTAYVSSHALAPHPLRSQAQAA